MKTFVNAVCFAHGEASASRPPEAEFEEPARSRRRSAALILVPAIVLLAGAWPVVRNRAVPELSTLAVLPFTYDADGDPSELAGGLHEDVVSALGQIDPMRLRVLSRRSTMAYVAAGKSPGQVGQELGADYLVEGSIREHGANWRVTFSVVNARDQVHVWSETFDRDRSSLRYLQTELSRAVAQQIRLRLSAARDQALVRRQARNPKAYEHYLRGRVLWSQARWSLCR